MHAVQSLLTERTGCVHACFMRIVSSAVSAYAHGETRLPKNWYCSKSSDWPVYACRILHGAMLGASPGHSTLH